MLLAARTAGLPARPRARSARRQDLPPCLFCCLESVGYGFGDGHERRAMIVGGDIAQTEAHQIEGAGEGERLVKRFFHIAGEREDTPPKSFAGHDPLGNLSG